LVFADLHYMLALGAAGRKEASNGMTGRYAIQATKQGEMPARIKDPGVAAMVGLEAFSEGRYDDAFANLSVARPTMQTVGGSHAQRDVFERITIDAGIRAGRFDQAEALLADRIARRGGNEDRFASTRFQSLAETRRIPAQ
ncbi:MAG: tetratricopeptide repeat protein, partial [Paracoccaceae bacterium]